MKAGQIVKVTWGFGPGAWQLAVVLELGAPPRFGELPKAKIRKWLDNKRRWTKAAQWVPVGWLSEDLTDRRPIVVRRATAAIGEAS